MKPIAVLGAGSWGSALALVLARNGHTVRLWDVNEDTRKEIAHKRTNERFLPGISFPENIQIPNTLEETAKDSQDLLLVIPSHVFPNVLKSLKPLLANDARIVWATKGLEANTGRFLSDVIKDILPDLSAMAILSGPSFAVEVAKGQPTAVVVASNNADFAKDLRTRFNDHLFDVQVSDDLIGVQLGGVVKNVLAVAVGISDGLGYGANANAAIVTKGLAEMCALGAALGAKQKTLFGLSGCGDTILTCGDNKSRNRRFGVALGKGLSQEEAIKSIGQVVESVYNIEAVYKLAKQNKVSMPIAEKMHEVLMRGLNAKEAIESLFSR